MTEISYESWEAIIGLEIHVQLNTQTKLFSGDPNRFGDEPNLNISEVSTGQPGALPVLNREAVRKAVQFGCAVNATVHRNSSFDRKSYFYPDCPRGFQITQFDHPIIEGGVVTADVEGVSKHFTIDRAHIEDDAGMLKHFSSFAGVDFNRSGVPLLEIVSTPCMHSPKDASAYAMAVRAIMQYIDASDCNMDEGSLRMDVNVSVRKKGETSLREKIEIKNLNSFSIMEMAIEAEILRQINAYSRSPHLPYAEAIQRGTYRFDVDKKTTVMMREKEEAADYRYFPEPDLPPLELSAEYIEEIRKALPELPHQRYKRYCEELHLTPYSASLLVNDKALSDYFEQALTLCSTPVSLCNWVCVEFVGRFKEANKSLPKSSLPPSHIAKLVSLIEEKKITGKIGKQVADIMVQFPEKDPEQIVSENPDFQPLHDHAAIEPLVDQVLAAHPQSIIDFREGKKRAFDFLVGQVMKLSKGKAAPEVVHQLLNKKMSAS